MINAEREKLEFESLPEFIREPYSSARESYVPPQGGKRAPVSEARAEVSPLAKTAELEALWPGVSHDFLHDTNRPPTFYLSIGFVAGLIVAVGGMFAFSSITHGGVATLPGKRVVVAESAGTAGNNQPGQSADRGSVTTRNPGSSSDELIVPLFPTYEVKQGDTMAGIALQAYKRVSPRLLDAICKANGLRSANVLSLGQKIVLPEYRSQASQVAAAGQTQ